MQAILTQTEIGQKITRLAHQIIENTFEEEVIYIAGIAGNGFELANRLGEIIRKNSTQQAEVFKITVDKENPWDHSPKLSIDQAELKHKMVILVDDVLNSGKTMQYALVKLLDEPTKAIKTVALVDRKHRRYPIKADFVGLSLSTTLKERVEVSFDPSNAGAYLV